MSKRRIVRWIAVALAVTLLTPMIAFGAITAMSKSRERRVHEATGQPIALEVTPELLTEGGRLFRSRGCGDCHGENGAGRVLMDSMPVAVVVPSNLTTLGESYDIAQFELAMRRGIGRDRQALVFMPAHEYQFMRDADVAALFAFTRSLPRVEGEQPPSRIGPVGRILHVAGLMPLFPAELVTESPARPEPGPTVGYGAALVAGCTGCHGAGLSGGPIPGAPIELVGTPLNLTPHETGLSGMTWEQFESAMREGRKRDGTEMDSAKMPWRNFAHMSDVEMRALWAYLQQVEPKPFGSR